MRARPDLAVRYGLRVNTTALVHASFVLVPLALAGVLALFIYTKKGPHPATFDMAEKWTHDPILWAADEPAEVQLPDHEATGELRDRVLHGVH